MISAEVKITWNGPRVAAGMLGATLDGIGAAANALAEKIKDNIGTQGPPASTPGEFPHRESGDLQRGIKVIHNRSKKTFRVISTAEHSEAVEETRPFIKRTFNESRSELRSIVLGRTRAKFGHFKLG